MRPRGRIYGATLTAFAVAVTAIVLSTGGGAPAAGAANLFVVPSGGSSSCARSATSVTFASATSGMKCDTWNRAYQAASNGDTVGIRTGAYSKQIFQERPGGISSPGITFVSDGGPVTTTTSIEFGGDIGNGLNDAATYRADWITMRGDFRPYGLYFVHADHNTLDGFTIDHLGDQNKAVFMGGDTDSNTITNSDVCCNDNQPLVYSNVPDGQTTGWANSNWTFSKSNFHSITRSDAGAHNECLFANAMPFLTLDRMHFYGCTVININAGGFNAGTSYEQTGWHIVNSVFECATDQTATDRLCQQPIQGCNAPDWFAKPGWVVEYNWFEEGWYHPTDGAGNQLCGDNGMTFRGNIMGGTVCPSNTTVNSGNVYTSSCGTGNTISASAFSSTNYVGYTGSGVNVNVRPTSGAVQVDKGGTTAGTYPATDYDGVTRFLGSAPDAGPFEGF